MTAAPRSFDYVRLRFTLIEPTDAAYIFKLRMDPTFNAHLSQMSGKVEDQRAWIERYKSREAAGTEYYYVMRKRDDGAPCGAVRLYEIQPDHFTWGSWILDTNKPQKAALESAVFVYRIGFDHLGLPKAVFDVRNDNAHTRSFHERFGARQTGQDDQDTFYDYTAKDFAQARAGFDAVLAGETV